MGHWNRNKEDEGRNYLIAKKYSGTSIFDWNRTFFKIKFTTTSKLQGFIFRKFFNKCLFYEW